MMYQHYGSSHSMTKDVIFQSEFELNDADVLKPFQEGPCEGYGSLGFGFIPTCSLTALLS